jgi:hypothetical protein
MKSWMKYSIALLGTMVLGGTALGGQQQYHPVVVSQTFRVAYGSMGDARNSADATQYIGCHLYSNSSGTTLACEAVDAAGTTGTCTTNDANMIATARSIGSASRIHFEWSSISGCTVLQVQNYSWARPA